MVRVLKKKTVKKVNVKLQKLRESEFHDTISEGYVVDSTNMTDDVDYVESSIEELKEKKIVQSKLSVAIDFVKNPDKLKTRYCFFSNKFTKEYTGVSISDDRKTIKTYMPGNMSFYPGQPINIVTLSITKDTIFYNLNTYKLVFKKHLYLSKQKPKGFVFDFNTGKLKLYPNTKLDELYKENKYAFRKMLDILGLEFITDEIIALDWLNRIGLEKAIKYLITSPKDIIKEKLRYSSIEYTEHTASLLYKSFNGFKNLQGQELSAVDELLYTHKFKKPNTGYYSFVRLFNNCINIDAYLISWNTYISDIEKVFIEWKNRGEPFPSDRVYELRKSFINCYSCIYDNEKHTKSYIPLYTARDFDFDDTKEQCSKLGEKINLSWSPSRLASFHDELTWKIMKIEADTLVDEHYYPDNISTEDSVHFHGLELITTKRRLYTEGASQHHCVFTNYHDKVKRLQYLVFSMVNKENKRITIGCTIDKKYTDFGSEFFFIKIEQMRLKRNDIVFREDENYIQNIILDDSFQAKVTSYIGLQTELEYMRNKGALLSQLDSIKRTTGNGILNIINDDQVPVNPNRVDENYPF